MQKSNSSESRASSAIGVGFALVIITMLGLAAAGLYTLSSAQNFFSRVVDQHIVQTELMHDIMRLAQERSLTLQHMLLTDDPFEQDEKISRMSEIVSQYLKLREQLWALPLTERERDLLIQQGEQTVKTGGLQSRVVDLVMNEHMNEAKQLLYSEAIPSQQRAMDLMAEFIALQGLHNSIEARNVAESVEQDKQLVAALTLFGLAISIAVAVYVLMRTVREIRERIAIENELEERVRERTEELYHRARHDPLTELPNRTVMDEQLKQTIALAKRYERCYALLFLDLDGFKKINDTHGHAAGDYVLKETAQRIDAVIRASDVFARMGGDEFAVILNEIKARQDLIDICNKIIAAVNQPLECKGQRCTLGVSIGVTFFSDDSRSADELLTEADDAMYQAKVGGKNRFHISEASGNGELLQAL